MEFIADFSCCVSDESQQSERIERIKQAIDEKINSTRNYLEFIDQFVRALKRVVAKTDETSPIHERRTPLTPELSNACTNIKNYVHETLEKVYENYTNINTIFDLIKNGQSEKGFFAYNTFQHSANRGCPGYVRLCQLPPASLPIANIIEIDVSDTNAGASVVYMDTITTHATQKLETVKPLLSQLDFNEKDNITELKHALTYAEKLDTSDPFSEFTNEIKIALEYTESIAPDLEQKKPIEENRMWSASLPACKVN